MSDPKHPGETEIRPDTGAPGPKKEWAGPRSRPLHGNLWDEDRTDARRDRGDRRQDRLHDSDDAQRVAARRIELRAGDEDRLESDRALERVVDPGLIEIRTSRVVDERHLDPAGHSAGRTREVGDVALLRLEGEVERGVGARRRAGALRRGVLVLVEEDERDRGLLNVAGLQ